MTKITYKRTSLILGSQFQMFRDYDHYGSEHGRRQGGRHGSRVVDESSHLIHWHKAERAKWKCYGLLKPHSWSQVTHPLQQGHTS